MVLRQLLCRLCTAQLPARVKLSNLLRKAHAGSRLLACRRCGCLAAQRLLIQHGPARSCGCERQAGRPARQSGMCVMRHACPIPEMLHHT